MYTEAAFQVLGQRLAQSPPTRQDVRAFSRLFYGQAQYVEIDSQGRIRIPPELASLAKLQNEVVLVGVQDHLEIWAAEHWQTYVADKQAHYDEIAETALGGLTQTNKDGGLRVRHCGNTVAVAWPPTADFASTSECTEVFPQVRGEWIPP